MLICIQIPIKSRLDYYLMLSDTKTFEFDIELSNKMIIPTLND